jgi:hypothetical protein
VLPGESVPSLRIRSHIVGQKLERYETTERNILGFVNHAHSATAKFLDYAVVRDGLA